MITRIATLKSEVCEISYIGQLYIVQGRLKHTWLRVTAPMPTYDQAVSELNDFAASVQPKVKKNISV